MVYAKFTAAVASIGTDVIMGFLIDNSRRVTRMRKPDGSMQSFAERFTIDAGLECLFVTDLDPKGVKANVCTSIEHIQGIIYVDAVEDLPKLDVRYIFG